MATAAVRDFSFELMRSTDGIQFESIAKILVMKKRMTVPLRIPSTCR
jgi:hypothetical protein